MRFLRLSILHVALIVLPCLGETSLELALSKAFNKKVQDGTYARIFDPLLNIASTSFCTGNADDWETPPSDEPSDLRRVLDRGEMICGYPSNLFYQQSLAGGQIMLDTADPNNVQGALVDWWDELGTELGRMYGKDSFRVKWNVSFEKSQDVLDAVQNGTFDAACGRWAPDGFWNDAANGKKVPRSVAFSVQICPSYAETGQIYTRNNRNITSFDILVAGINNGTVKTVTAEGSVGGGTEQTCSNQLSQYTTSPISCTGISGNDAFGRLDSDESDAHWGGIPKFATMYNRIEQPSLYTPVTLFRKEDLINVTYTTSAAMYESVLSSSNWMLLLIVGALLV